MKLFGVKKASSGSTLTIPIPPSLPAGFIFRKDHVLYEPLTDGTAVPLKFCSLNIPNLHALEDRPGAPGNWDIPTEWEQRDALKSVYLLGGKVARIYVISVGAAHRHVPQPGVYNDRMFQALDSALAIASEFGIKLILVCVDQWSWWGGIEQWAAFRNKRELQFWEDPTVRADFKHMLTYLVTRVNTKTGVRYCDDPTIFGWETTNEGGGWDYTPPADWTLDIARHIKSLDPHHLVIDGTLGGQTASGSPKWAKDVLESEGLVDVMTNHYYVCDSSLRDYARWAERDSKLAKKYRKAFFVGEYGFAPTEAYDHLLRWVSSSENCAGTLIWSLRFHARDGGFYVHSEDKGYWAYHFPGFPENSSNGFPSDEAKTVALIRKYARSTQSNASAGGSKAKLESPSLWQDSNGLRFRGSTGAYMYRVLRALPAPSPPSQGWEEVGTVLDNVKPGEARIPHIWVLRGHWFCICAVMQGVGGREGDQVAYSNPLIAM